MSLLALLCANPVALLAVHSGGGGKETQEAAPSVATDLEFQVRKVISLPGIGDVSDFALVQAESSPVLLVAGTCGFAEVDHVQEVVLRTQPFELPCDYPSLESRIVDMDADGELDFARFTSGWAGPTALLDRKGAVRWQDPTPAQCDDVMDLDGDGKLEVFVSEPNSKTGKLLDNEGRVRWERDFEVTNMDVVAHDTDGDGKQELLVKDPKGVRIYSGGGKETGLTALPGGRGANWLRIAVLGTGSGDHEVIVGTYVPNGQEKGQWYHRYARDAKTHLGSQRSRERLEFTAEVPPSGTRGRLFLTLVNHKEQAFPAGFKASELALYISAENGEQIGEHRFSKADRKVAVADGALLVLQGDPARILVGYGDGLWEVAVH